ncbi:MAG TPA: glycoside hydrolase family 3 N-terminal domain-containing protein [Verrucomicrobiae bacterium]|nr:glycoside hydrolase family 3 N-terminal domain-containing protein [Verrucomicrobiae bacterium]
MTIDMRTGHKLAQKYMPSPVTPLQRLSDALIIIALTATVSLALADEPPYEDPSLPVDQRVADLLGRMTLEEKARQLDLYDAKTTLVTKINLLNGVQVKPGTPFVPDRAEKAFGNLGVGAIHELYPDAQFYNALQTWVMQHGRLGIPVLLTGEGLHGYMGYDATIFPQSVNLATTWNVDLVRDEGAAIASETRAHGVDMILAPVLDVAREPRWGRVEEDFGEDPFLSGQLGLAYVEGVQGDSLATDHTCIAEPKHFAGYGSPESGINTSPVHAGEREARMYMLKSFEPAIREGHAMGVMVAYNDIDGVPCTANPWLLREVLRGEWGFQGFTLADDGAIRRLYTDHHVAASPADAARLAVNSGVDMQFYDFAPDTFQNALIQGIKDGSVSENTLDHAVGGVLRVKFLLGLFDHPFIDTNLERSVCRSPAHLDLSLEVARQSMCLLKNQDHLLPLDKNQKRITVIGPNALVVQTGDYTGHQASLDTPEYSIAAQVKDIVSPNTLVRTGDGQDIENAVELATNSDVVILALGENSKLSGEGHDRSNLDLPGNQEQLLEAVAATGVPVVLVLENGRPLTIPWAAEHVPAILEAWYPGEFGGRAVAETLFGDNNPAGRLSISFPEATGQLPVFYNHFPSKRNRFVDGNDSPLFPFGFGLSYTQFKYENLNVSVPQSGSDGDLLVTFDLTNTGQRDGDEVAQAYVREMTASVATPERALKAFSRIHLNAGETQTVTLHIKRSDLAVWGANRKWAVEPGQFTVWVGGNSQATLTNTFNLQ